MSVAALGSCGDCALSAVASRPTTAAPVKLGAVAKGIDPEAERLEPPFVAPRQFVDWAWVDLLGHQIRDARSARKPIAFHSRVRGIFVIVVASVRQDPSRMHQVRLPVIPCTSRNCVPRDGSLIAQAGCLASRDASDFSLTTKPPLITFLARQ